MTADGFRPSRISSARCRKRNFKSAMWAFDSKNKVSKKQSESDAGLQIDDFVASAAIATPWKRRLVPPK